MSACRYMHWSWQEFEDTPQRVIDILIDVVQKENERRDADAQLKEMQGKQVGGGRRL